jgi:hypothetical protein
MSPFLNDLLKLIKFNFCLDYPLSKLDPKLEKFFLSTIKSVPTVDAQLTADYCFSNLLVDTNNTKSNHGYKLFIQLLIKQDKSTSNANIFVNNTSKYCRELEENKHRHKNCLQALWSLGQVGYANLNKGLTIWYDVMLPFIGQKQFTNYIACYLNSIFDCHRNLINNTNNNGVIIRLDHYLQCYDIVNDDNKLGLNLQKDSQKKMEASLKTMRLIYSKSCHKNFEELLSSLPTTPDNKQKEVTNIHFFEL